MAGGVQTTIVITVEIEGGEKPACVVESLCPLPSASARSPDGASGVRTVAPWTCASRPRRTPSARRSRTYLDELLHGEFAAIRGRGGPGDEHAFFDERLAWERRLGADGWTCVGWPTEFGGRGLPLDQQVICFEEYARAGGPGRLGHIGEGLSARR